MRLEVECYAGYRGQERPIRFRIGRRRVEVVDTLDRWIGEDHRYFKVRGDDGGIYILRLDLERGVWELTLFERPR